jgi:hypothetical protein
MGILSKIFGSSNKEENKGIDIGSPPWWEINPPSDVALFFKNLPELLPSDSILYFEGTLDDQVSDLLNKFEISNPVLVQRGTLWPKPDIHHTSMNKELLDGIAQLINDGVVPYPSSHFHAYRENKILLEWHDAFIDDPMLLSVDISEDTVRQFCNLINSSYSYFKKKR